MRVCREGVDLKINVSGDTLLPRARSAQTVMTEAEVAAVCAAAHAHDGGWPARCNPESVNCARHGVQILYHVNVADEGARLLDRTRTRCSSRRWAES